MRVAIVDIETPPIVDLIDNISKIYCIGVKINNTPTKCFTYLYQTYSDGTLAAALALINSCDIVIGHNICKFDRPVIEKLLGKIKPKVVDTLIDAKLVYSKDELIAIDYGLKDFPKALIGSYSLQAFGLRFNFNKIFYEDFSSLSSDMVTYCKRDVDLTYKLYTHLLTHPNYPKESIRECEYSFARIIYQQENYGFYFDIDKAYQLATKLKFKQISCEHKLLKLFPPIFVADGEVIAPSKATKRKVYVDVALPKYFNIMPFAIPLKIRKNGTYKFPPKTIKYKLTPYRIVISLVCGEYQKIKLVKFNPNSRSQIVDRLNRRYGWTPYSYTAKGNPQFKEISLEESLKELKESI